MRALYPHTDGETTNPTDGVRVFYEVFGPTDACVTPVLSLVEAASHPHNLARETFVEVDGVLQPSPAPRFGSVPRSEPRRFGPRPTPDWAVESS